MRAPRSFGESSLDFDNEGVEGEFIGDRDWELGGLVWEVSWVTERAFPQPDRSASKRRCDTMQINWSQSSLARNGVFLNISVYFFVGLLLWKEDSLGK